MTENNKGWKIIAHQDEGKPMAGHMVRVFYDGQEVSNVRAATVRFDVANIARLDLEVFLSDCDIKGFLDTQILTIPRKSSA